MKNKFSLSAITITFFFVTACNKNSTELAVYIPKDASVVFTADLKTITDKINSSGVSIDSLVNLFSDSDAEVKANWDDIKNSGIDLNKSLYFFAKQNNSIQKGNSQIAALIAEVKDDNKLEAFLKKQKPKNNVSSADGFKYIDLGSSFIAGWTDKVLIISSANQSENNNSEAATVQQLQTLFNQKKSASIASADEFKEALSKQGDIHFYTNTSNSLSSAPVPGASKLNELLQNSYTTGVINFDKGKMTGSSESHYGKALSDILEKYPPKEISADMIKKYPGELSGFGVVSFNPHVLIDILHYTGFDMMANGFAQNMGFSTNDIINALSGDMALMFSPRTDKNGQTFSPPNPGFLLNMRIGDKAAFDRVMSGLLNKQILTKHDDEYELGMAGGHGFVIEADNAGLYISSSDELIKSYQSPVAKSTLPADVEKEITGKSMALYADINKLLSNKSVSDSNVDIHLHDTYDAFKISQAAKATFKNFIVTGNVSNNKVFKTEYKLNFIDENVNSLAAFTKFMVIAHSKKMQH